MGDDALLAVRLLTNRDEWPSLLSIGGGWLVGGSWKVRGACLVVMAVVVAGQGLVNARHSLMHTQRSAQPSVVVRSPRRECE